MLWALPMLASGLLALLRYGFGSLFVIGERVASVLLASSGAGIGGTVQRLQAAPLRSAAEAAAGLLGSGAAAGLSPRQPFAAAAVALATAAGAWWYGLPVAAALLGAAAFICVSAAIRG